MSAFIWVGHGVLLGNRVEISIKKKQKTGKILI